MYRGVFFDINDHWHHLKFSMFIYELNAHCRGYNFHLGYILRILEVCQSIRNFSHVFSFITICHKYGSSSSFIKTVAPNPGASFMQNLSFFLFFNLTWEFEHLYRKSSNTYAHFADRRIGWYRWKRRQISYTSHSSLSNTKLPHRPNDQDQDMLYYHCRELCLGLSVAQTFT